MRVTYLVFAIKVFCLYFSFLLSASATVTLFSPVLSSEGQTRAESVEPLPVRVGGVMRISWIAENFPTSSGSASVRHYISTNTTISAGDLLIGQSTISRNVAGTGINDNVNIPVLAPGIYYVGTCVDSCRFAGSISISAESNEPDFTLFSPAIEYEGRLQQELSGGILNVVPGGDLTVRWIVENASLTTGETRASHYLSINTTISRADRRFGQTLLANNRAFFSINQSSSVPSLRPGIYYVGTCIEEPSGDYCRLGGVVSLRSRTSSAVAEIMPPIINLVLD